jgi:glycosyltransferase involved in cell wall biosynthesis
MPLENILTLPNKRLSNNIFISEEELNLEYNISNAFVCSSVAEGFGLPILESQRCGLIPVVPNCSAMAEIVNQGELCKALNFFASNEQEVGVVNPSDLANSMYQVFFHKDKYRKNENISYAQSFSNKNMISSLEEIFDSDKDVKFPFDEI